MNEVQFSAWLRGKLPGHVMRVENTADPGTPDIMWSEVGRTIWIETKILVRGNALLRPAQYAWGMRHAACQGNSQVVALDTQEDKVHVWRFPFAIMPVHKYLAVSWDDVNRLTVSRHSFFYGLLLGTLKQ